MAKPGPRPKHPDERRRTNDTGEEITDLNAMQPTGDANDILLLIMEPISVPEVDGIWAELPEPESDGTIVFDPNDENVYVGWHPLVKDMWESFKRSGQAVFWEPSDWMLAVLFCENLSRDLKPQFVGTRVVDESGAQEAIYEAIPFKGASMNAYLKLAAQLGLTEGERRSMGMILKRERDQRVKLATVSSADDRRRQLAARREASQG